MRKNICEKIPIKLYFGIYRSRERQPGPGRGNPTAVGPRCATYPLPEGNRVASSAVLAGCAAAYQ